MLVTKNSLGIWDLDDKDRGESILASQTKVEDPPIQKEVIINEKQEEDKMVNTSVELMKREKELEARRKELESLLAEVTKEEKAVEKELFEKGWTQQEDGSWGIT